MALIRDYLDKTQKYINEFGENTIVLMQVGAFFEVYGLTNEKKEIIKSNIMDFSRICDLNIGEKNVCVGTNSVVMAGFKDHLLDKYVKKLQDAGFTVPVYLQDEQCPGSIITRSLLEIFSPGTYFSNDTESITNNTCCIWIEVKKTMLKCANKMVYVGVSQIDIFTGQTSIMEYNEIYINNPTTFDNLERFISIYNPSETIIITNLSSSEIDDIVSYINVKSKTIHFVNLLDNDTKHNVQRALNCEKQTFQTQLLQQFYIINDITSFMTIFNDNVYATQSFCYLLDFIYQHNPNLINKVSEPILENTSEKLILANHSLKQLNIIDDDNYKGKYSSVIKMLNECITSMGKRKFAHNFFNPTTNTTYLDKEYNITSHLLQNKSEYVKVKTMLYSFKDISKLNRQIMLQKISPKALHQLYCSLLSAKDLYKYVSENPELYTYLSDIIPGFDDLLVQIDSITLYIDSVLIIEQGMDIDNIHKIDYSFIRNGFDIEFDSKLNTFLDSRDQLDCCRRYFNSIVSNYEGNKKSKKKTNEDTDTDTEYVKENETGKNNFSLIATDRRCKIIADIISKEKSSLKILKYTSSFSTEDSIFTLNIGDKIIEYNKQTASNYSISSPQINKLCNDVSTIKVNLFGVIAKVYAKIIKSLEKYNESIDKIGEFITYVDIAFCKMHVADKYNYCKPIIDNSVDKSFVEVKELRHCLIEKIQQSELYVTNDITIGGYNGTNNGTIDGILLYGTNAVGKTSFIRALGISVIMAQAGLYVPASQFVFKPYKYIFTRILGNDNLFKGLSTFAVEMSELRTILRLADKNSLVLGDELCSGTESISAVSIFVAGIDALHQKQCSFIFATHLHEIINYEEITSLKSVVLRHMSVIYDREKDMLIYDRKLKDGPGNNMYGLEVCKSLALPQDFLNAAHNIRMKYHPESASILDKKTSHFNSKCIKNMCEKCGKHMTSEFHHLQYQSDANDDGIIKQNGLTFHKNHKANLLGLCGKCHDEFHKTDIPHKKVKTSKGIIIAPIF